MIDTSKTNVPNIRIHFRTEILAQERLLVEQIGKHLGEQVSESVKVKLTPKQHYELTLTQEPGILVPPTNETKKLANNGKETDLVPIPGRTNKYTSVKAIGGSLLLVGLATAVFSFMRK